MQTFHIYSESTELQSVVIGTSRQFRADQSYVEYINKKQIDTKPPTEEVLHSELQGFRDVLISRGIEVFIPTAIGSFVPDQLTPRDIGFIIGDKLVISNMSCSSRRYEVFGILETIKLFDLSDKKVLIPDADVWIEGGDVIVDKNCIYLGQSNRTNKNGLDFIRRHFSRDFDVFPITVNDHANESRFLHLDCVFNPVGSSHALFFRDGVIDIPDRVLKNYEIIEIDEYEQAELATNILTISSETVIVRKSEKLNRVNTLLKAHYDVIEIDFSSVVATGGSLRCASLPLIRK
ncbi:hypothetical protein JMN32_14760 [Fulvivirga sp. 29W222]|uniref:arginine deiminase n=1 Tax=Fulvivirga marina TaxID=2494733 RepID=A0A937FYY2_9BACT|nr:arginine deiminase family protein [Fulvivirga marina]MBL6447577.1 hypothetical protein [Fulvivirga marina]